MGKEAAEDLVGSVGMLFGLGVAVHMAVRVPMNFVWRWAAAAWSHRGGDGRVVGTMLSPSDGSIFACYFFSSL